MYVMYYASMLQYWQLIRILVRTNHPCLRVGRHTGAHWNAGSTRAAGGNISDDWRRAVVKPGGAPAARGNRRACHTSPNQREGAAMEGAHRVGEVAMATARNAMRKRWLWWWVLDGRSPEGSRLLPRALGEKMWCGEREEGGSYRGTLKRHIGWLCGEEMEGGRGGTSYCHAEKGRGEGSGARARSGRQGPLAGGHGRRW
jgi:hypothetical protein